MPRRILYVYILSSRSRILYVGVTNNLARRLMEHRDPIPDSRAYSARHQTRILVYFERFEQPMAAIRREKEIKGWNRQRKLALIEALNPSWSDLGSDFLAVDR